MVSVPFERAVFPSNIFYGYILINEVGTLWVYCLSLCWSWFGVARERHAVRFGEFWTYQEPLKLL